MGPGSSCNRESWLANASSHVYRYNLRALMLQCPDCGCHTLQERERAALAKPLPTAQPSAASAPAEPSKPSAPAPAAAAPSQPVCDPAIALLPLILGACPLTSPDTGSNVTFSLLIQQARKRAPIPAPGQQAAAAQPAAPAAAAKPAAASRPAPARAKAAAPAAKPAAAAKGAKPSTPRTAKPGVGPTAGSTEVRGGSQCNVLLQRRQH